MFNVLIIDDEPNVRLGLKKIVPWEENGFRVCGEGIDAEDGLEKIMNLKPDIVLIDIKMPGKLGTEVIKEAIESGFEGKFIIVSGYSNFEYAKDGMKYGVKSYILKPIDEDELIEILIELKKEIQNEEKWKHNKKLIEHINIKNMIIDGDKEIEKNYLRYETFKVALISDNVDKGIDEKNINVYELIEKNLDHHNDVDVVSIDRDTVLLLKDFKKSRIIKTIMDLKIKLEKEMDYQLFITLGSEVNKPEKINKSYKEAKDLMDNKFLYLDRGIISQEELEENTEKESLNIQINFEKIYSYVDVNDLEKLKNEIIKLKDYMIKIKCSEKEAKIIVTKMFLDFKEKIDKDYNLNKNLIMNNEDIMKDIYSEVSLDSIINYLIDKFINISNEIGDISSDNIIKRVINYMNRNYYKDLKLEILSEIFNYNSAYLGKLFKNSVGESFNTYLDKIRIEKAKSLLLEDQLKVYQVCEKVGYKNIDYFHSKFKKYVGISPMNYKKQNECKI